LIITKSNFETHIKIKTNKMALLYTHAAYPVYRLSYGYGLGYYF